MAYEARETGYENEIPLGVSPREVLTWHIVNLRARRTGETGFLPPSFFIRERLVAEMVDDADFDPAEHLTLLPEAMDPQIYEHDRDIAVITALEDLGIDEDNPAYASALEAATKAVDRMFKYDEFLEQQRGEVADGSSS